MNASVIRQTDGAIGIYYLSKENGGASTFGRSITRDGVHFDTERCDCRIAHAYYEVNNDRFERLRDGRIAVPAARSINDLSVG